jgi:hypothetical protein
VQAARRAISAARDNLVIALRMGVEGPGQRLTASRRHLPGRIDKPMAECYNDRGQFRRLVGHTARNGTPDAIKEV